MSRRIKFLIEAVNQTREPFQEVENGLERLRTTRLDASRVVMEQARAEKYLRAVYKYQYQAYYDAAGVMKQVGSIGTQLIGIVNQRNLAELRLGDTLRDVAESQRLANTAFALYGADSVQYKKATEDLTEAQKRYKKAVDDATMGNLGAAMSMVGMAGSASHLILTLKMMGVTVDSIIGAVTQLGALLSGLAVPAAILAPAFLAPFLSTEEQKQQALLNTYQKQGFVSTVLGGGITPGAPGAEDWIDLIGPTKGTVGETIGGTDPWDPWLSQNIKEQKKDVKLEAAAAPTTTKVTQTVEVNIASVTNQANVDAVARAVQKALVNKQRDIY